MTPLRPHLLGSVNFSRFQSAYRKGYSTKTALLKVLDNVYTAANDKQVTVLIGLDLSTAFDTSTTVYYSNGCSPSSALPLAWLQSYLEGRTQFVKLGLHQSPVVDHFWD